MKLIYSLLLSVLLISCQENSSEEIDLAGHWQSLTDGVHDIYTEFYFHEDTIERFNIDWELLPYAKYEIREDSLITNIRYKIDIQGEQSIALISEFDTIQLNKLITNGVTIEQLLNEGYFAKDLNDSIYRKKMNSFINESFRIRELEYKFDRAILNKDTLLTFWKSQLTADSLNKGLYELWIKEFEKK
ncbi:MAG: hypothetical protein R8N23_08290 [Reichenbachiella sp.]|uniref:hypothetical protein n=1 Tax=Reichenbachiella sp. TaxID=2184521 RepID=UPI00296756E9|nr:hypothetical protein [Reichenbachiella sp.]MDW3209852.1 hypothetical protein [Reichenbachiella sp.]